MTEEQRRKVWREAWMQAYYKGFIDGGGQVGRAFMPDEGEGPEGVEFTEFVEGPLARWARSRDRHPEPNEFPPIFEKKDPT